MLCIHSLITLAGCGAALALGGAVDRFRNPPADGRILKIIHGWPDDPAQQDVWIAGLKRQGFGGVVCNVSFQDYLRSATAWAAFGRAVGAAREAGFALWLYDEKGYPSGSAGGQVLQGHPDWEAEGLLAVDQPCGPGPVSLQVPPGERVFAEAYPVVDGVAQVNRGVDLESAIKGQQLRWDAPKGQWHLLVLSRSRLYEGTHAEGNLAEAMPYPNLLRPEPTARFLELTHNRYAYHLGPDLGGRFVATFTDEPSLMSMFLRRMPWRPLPWAPDLPEAFERRHGYPLEPVLPSLVLDTGPGGLKHRHDFWQTIGALVSRNFFGQIQETCHRFRIRSGGHLLAEEGLTSHVALYGDFFECLRRLDAPSIDCLTSIPSEVPWHIAKLAGSAADLAGNPIVMCETSDHGQVWRPAGDERPRRTVTEAEIRGTMNRLMVSGVNSITSYYSFGGLDDAALVRLNNWAGRIAALMRGGSSAGSIAVVYPADALATHFVPAHHWAGASPAANRIDVLFRTVLEELFAARREFTVIDDRTLAEARAKDGALEHADMSWRVIILPGADVLSWAAWQNLERFVHGGGRVIVAGERPSSDGQEFPSGRVRELGHRILGPPRQRESLTVRGPGTKGGMGAFLPAGQELLLAPLLDAWLPADAVCDPPGGSLRAGHRRIAGQDVFLVINDRAEPWEGRLTLAAGGRGHELDPASGEVKSGVAADGIAVRLEGFSARGYVFPRPAEQRSGQAATHALPRLVEQPLPVEDPVVSRGEWVREDFRALTHPAGVAGWQVNAQLTRGEVDTFLFVRFPVAGAADLAEADGMGFDVGVPAGPKPSTQLLVILQERGGGDFLAATACSLAWAGRMQLAIPWSHFQLAGWSRDADGVLDRSNVAEVRIGWGGYHGAEGEAVEFTTSSPRVVRVSE